MGAALGAMCSQHNEQVRNIGGTIPVQIRTVRLSGCETGPSGCEGIFWAPTHGLVTHATLRATRDPLHHTKHQRARPQHVPVPVPTHVRTSHPNAPRTDCTLAFCVYARLLRTRDPRRGTRARAVLSCTAAQAVYTRTSVHGRRIHSIHPQALCMDSLCNHKEQSRQL